MFIGTGVTTTFYTFSCCSQPSGATGNIGSERKGDEREKGANFVEMKSNQNYFTMLPKYEAQK